MGKIFIGVETLRRVNHVKRFTCCSGMRGVWWEAKRLGRYWGTECDRMFSVLLVVVLRLGI